VQSFEPRTLPHSSVDWAEVALCPPKCYIGPRNGNDKKHLKEIVQSMAFELSDFTTMQLLSIDDQNNLLELAKKDLDGMEKPPGGYLNAGDTIDYMKRCKYRLKVLLHQQSVSNGTDGSDDHEHKAK